MMLEKCDGCGWEKKIVLVDNFGKGFCIDCIKNASWYEGVEI